MRKEEDCVNIERINDYINREQIMSIVKMMWRMIFFFYVQDS